MGWLLIRSTSREPTSRHVLGDWHPARPTSRVSPGGWRQSESQTWRHVQSEATSGVKRPFRHNQPCLRRPRLRQVTHEKIARPVESNCCGYASAGGVRAHGVIWSRASMREPKRVMQHLRPMRHSLRCGCTPQLTGAVSVTRFTQMPVGQLNVVGPHHA